MEKTFPDPLFPLVVRRLPEGYVKLGASHREILFARTVVRPRGKTGEMEERSNEAVAVPDGTSIRVYAGGNGAFRLGLGAALIEGLDLRRWEDDLLAPLQCDRVTRYALSTAAADRAVAALSRAATELDQNIPGYRSAALAALEDFLVLLLRARLPASEGGRPHRAVWRLADLVEHLREHYADEFSLAEMASLCGMNQSSFSRTFKSAAGVPPFEFINRVRIEKACLLLKKSQLSVIDIALSVGYNNVSFFNRYFKRVMGASPSEYRRAIRR